jgi:small subunit ribosomal protein S17
MSRNIGITVAFPRKSCGDKSCPFHGTLSIRGKSFTGTVATANARNMVVVEREYPRIVMKYKRYERSKSRMHAYVPDCIEAKEGDIVRIAECRPLSKTISFVVIEVNSGISG